MTDPVTTYVIEAQDPSGGESITASGPTADQAEVALDAAFGVRTHPDGRERTAG